MIAEILEKLLCSRETLLGALLLVKSRNAHALPDR